MKITKENKVVLNKKEITKDLKKYLDNSIILEKGVTLKNIFKVVEKNEKELKSILKHYSYKEYIEESKLTPIRKNFIVNILEIKEGELIVRNKGEKEKYCIGFLPTQYFIDAEVLLKNKMTLKELIVTIFDEIDEYENIEKRDKEYKELLDRINNIKEDKETYEIKDIEKFLEEVE